MVPMNTRESFVVHGTHYCKSLYLDVNLGQLPVWADKLPATLQRAITLSDVQSSDVANILNQHLADNEHDLLLGWMEQVDAADGIAYSLASVRGLLRQEDMPDAEKRRFSSTPPPSPPKHRSHPGSTTVRNLQ